MTRSYSVDQMRDFANAADKRNDKSWLTSQEERKRLESEFHDKKHEEMEKAKADKAMDTYEAVYTNRKYYKAVRACSDYTNAWIERECKGQIVLDYCCGVGGTSIKAAKAGADLVIGIDISESSLKVAQKRAEAEGVADRILFILGDAENTGLPEGSVERTICSGVLHHLDLDHAGPELFRVTAPGGKVLSIEALDYNPAIKLYRMRTPDLRTEWEKAHILSLKDVRKMGEYFEVPDIRFWHITAIAAPHLPGFMLPVLNGLDRVLEKIPMVQRLAWMFTFEMRKPLTG
ncbi:class I SAM-dependent methyltransferase [Roseovarius spongiae]|uniref:Class I SAM-dependent methyltransferase n=1 Tax=Roseovarius spongiae TaxID=2320272 RepID=A0A3A8B3P5_9RHOB|nr:class I SAM-dependent methyltransferase [Roseovarius spongiae]RKF12424.1 class I SAM-dependent methyltransferase [Roseovarius spongiae]